MVGQPRGLTRWHSALWHGREVVGHLLEHPERVRTVQVAPISVFMGFTAGSSKGIDGFQ